MDERNDYNSIPDISKMETTKPINMKTPMQKMIQNIIDIEKKTYNKEQLYMLNALKIGGLILLEEEKEQIKKAYKDHHDLGHLYALDGEDYFNDKYNKKQNNMKQTAVQSFWSKITLRLSVEQVNEFLPELQKALEMEKAQNMKAYKNGYVINRVSKRS